MPASTVTTSAPSPNAPPAEPSPSDAPFPHFPTAAPPTPVHSPSLATSRLKSFLHLNALAASLLALTVLLFPKTTAAALALPTPTLTLLLALALALFAAAVFKTATKNSHSRRHIQAVVVCNLFACVLTTVFLLLHTNKLQPPALRLFIAVAILAFAFAAAQLYLLRASSHPYSHTNSEIIAI